MAAEEPPKKSITHYDGNSYKREFVSKNGDIKTITYKKNVGTRTVNEQLTENMDETIKRWKEESVAVIKDDFENNLKKYKGYYCRYQTVLKQGKDKGKLAVRNGGFIAAVEKDFVYLTSVIGGWSLQYEDARQIFVKIKKPRGRKKKPKVPKALRAGQAEVQNEIIAEEAQEAEEQEKAR